MLRTLNTLALAAALALAAGCATTSPDVVSRSDAQRMSSVTDAVVLSTRPVVVDGTQSGIGALWIKARARQERGRTSCGGMRPRRPLHRSCYA